MMAFVQDAKNKLARGN